MFEKHNLRLSRVLVTGSDGEKPLKDALNIRFSSAVHLLCDIHMEDNVRAKLSNLNMPKDVIDQYMTDIFGIRLENQQLKGLVHCSSASDLMESYQLAMIGRGQLKVSEQYSDLCCEDVKFFRKSEDQKKAAHSKFFNADVRPTSLSGLLDAERLDEETTSLSILPENSKIAKFCRSHSQLLKKFLQMVLNCCLLITVSSLHQVLLTQVSTLPIRQTKANRSWLNVYLQETRLVVAYVKVTNTVFDILVFTFAVMLLQLRSTIKSCKSFLMYLTPVL